MSTEENMEKTFKALKKFTFEDAFIYRCDMHPTQSITHFTEVTGWTLEEFSRECTHRKQYPMHILGGNDVHDIYLRLLK